MRVKVYVRVSGLDAPVGVHVAPAMATRASMASHGDGRSCDRRTEIQDPRGPLPELANGRLAMLGFAACIVRFRSRSTLRMHAGTCEGVS